MLVTLVHLGRLTQLPVRFAHHYQANQDDRRQRHQAQHITTDGIEQPATGQVFETVGQVRCFVEQGLGKVEDVAGRLAHLEQFRRSLENFVDRAGNELEQLGNFRQARTGIAVLHLRDVNRRIATQHAIEYLAETGGIATKGVSGLHGVFIPGQYRVHRAQNTFGQQRLTLGHGHLGCRCTPLQQDLHHLFVFDLQLRYRFGQGCRHLVQ
ncbi:hypothetical protein D9M71_226080 [compost metagenome]